MVCKDREIDLYNLEEEPEKVECGEWIFSGMVAEWARKKLQNDYKGRRCLFGKTPSVYAYEAKMMVGVVKDIDVSLNEETGECTVEIDTKEGNYYYYNMGTLAICSLEEGELIEDKNCKNQKI